MSNELQQFALKVATALENYAEQPLASLNTSVPFHASMLKMATALKHRQGGMEKSAIIGLLGPGLLAASVGHHYYKKLLPKLQQAVMGTVGPENLMTHGIADMVSRAGGNTADAADTLYRALKRDPAGQMVIERLGQDTAQSSIKPWQLGLAAAGGLAGGQMLSRKEQSGPPMIFK